MSRIHGKDGRIYVAATSGGEAEPVLNLSQWSINHSSERQEVTAMGDTNKVWVQGLPDAAGDFQGFYDTESDGLYDAARDGLARKFYLYPTILDSATYYQGEAFFDWAEQGSVGSPVTTRGAWSAAGPVTKVST